MRIKVVKEIISGTHRGQLLCSVWGVRWRGMKVALSRYKKGKRKVRIRNCGRCYATGRKIEFNQKYQIPKDR
jgi:hypothetical protein